MIELLIFGLLLLTVICLWLLIEGRKNPKFLVWFIPVLLILVSSTYFTYNSILGFPRYEIPKEGVYLKHYVDEPKWIYLWVVYKDKIPISYKIKYTKKTHNSLEGVRGKAEQEGKFMVLRDMESMNATNEGRKGNQFGGGFTIGGDVSFYECDYRSMMPRKDQ